MEVPYLLKTLLPSNKSVTLSPGTLLKIKTLVTAAEVLVVYKKSRKSVILCLEKIITGNLMSICVIASCIALVSLLSSEEEQL